MFTFEFGKNYMPLFVPESILRLIENKNTVTGDILFCMYRHCIVAEKIYSLCLLY